MKQITLTAYSFHELSDKAKDKARQWMRECIGADTQWADCIIEDAKNAGVMLPEWDADSGTAQAHCPNVHESMQLILKDHGRECDTYKATHAYMLEIERVALATEWPEDEADEAMDAAVSRFQNELGAAYGKMLRDEMEYQFYGLGLDETIEANDYLFTKDGSRTAVLNA